VWLNPTKTPLLDKFHDISIIIPLISLYFYCPHENTIVSRENSMENLLFELPSIIIYLAVVKKGFLQTYLFLSTNWEKDIHDVNQNVAKLIACTWSAWHA
jgi:hypothetical protein